MHGIVRSILSAIFAVSVYVCWHWNYMWVDMRVCIQCLQCLQCHQCLQGLWGYVASAGLKWVRYWILYSVYKVCNVCKVHMGLLPAHVWYGTVVSIYYIFVGYCGKDVRLCTHCMQWMQCLYGYLGIACMSGFLWLLLLNNIGGVCNVCIVFMGMFIIGMCGYDMGLYAMSAVSAVSI